MGVREKYARAMGCFCTGDQQGVRIEPRLAGKRKARRTRARKRRGWRKKGKKEETARNGGGGKEE